MFYKLKKTLVATVLLPLALGCKREALTEQLASPGSTTKMGKVQQWLKNQPLSLSAQGRTAGNTLPNHTLLWQQATYNPSGKAHTVPLLLTKESNVRPPLQAALLATENATGEIDGGQYLLLLPKGKTAGQKPFMGLDATGLPMGQTDFSGALLYYNTAGRFTAGKVFKDGKLQANASATLAARTKPKATTGAGQASRTGESPSPNKVPINCEGGLDNACIEWYWQTYVNGQLVDEEYLFTTCCFTNGGGSGTGINNLPAITSCERTQAQAQAILEGIQLENINIKTANYGSIMPIGPDSIIRVHKQVKWDFLKLHLYLDFYLRYTMVFNGVVFKNNVRDPYWKWESINGGELQRTGTMAPCMNVNFTYSLVPPLISADKKIATTAITYTAIASVPCLFGVEAGTYTGGHPYEEIWAN